MQLSTANNRLTPEICGLPSPPHFIWPSSCSKGCRISLKLVCCLPCQLFLKELIGAIRGDCEGVASLHAWATTHRVLQAHSMLPCPGKMQLCGALQVAPATLHKHAACPSPLLCNIIALSIPRPIRLGGQKLIEKAEPVKPGPQCRPGT